MAAKEPEGTVEVEVLTEVLVLEETSAGTLGCNRLFSMITGPVWAMAVGHRNAFWEIVKIKTLITAKAFLNESVMENLLFEIKIANSNGRVFICQTHEKISDVAVGQCPLTLYSAIKRYPGKTRIHPEFTPQFPNSSNRNVPPISNLRVMRMAFFDPVQGFHNP